MIKTFIKKILEKRNEKTKYKTKYVVEGHGNDEKYLLFVLAGYKDFLWDDVFKRIKDYQLKNMDVCIASSGVYNSRLSDICKRNNWVYLSTKLNNVCVITNVIMRLFDKAEYIFKLDEDIYIPNGYFEDMLTTYRQIEDNEPVKIGYLCPMLPLGFYGMHKFLIDNNCLTEYEEKFGKHFIGGSTVNRSFRKGDGVDEFIWEKIGCFDKKALEYKNKGEDYEACFSRSGIAAVLFKRDFWTEMGGLKRGRGIGVGNAGDEGQITAYCYLNYKVCFCANNILVGHFSFGGSEQNVLAFKEKHPFIFNQIEEH